ncbi:NADPH-dependent FMN reductase [Desulfovibrio sp. X2]|uniref:flavodoxin family protein n=1 Tax=Desulfovibrio sp. X2 TaxID=941449 RepID=UPI0003587DC1|nr:flavodoxin family protein [Desulfovibrio sp. X2]EPR44505.1 NADPH-dependent FMN reductase [Desulfovibrio sp. X2]
MKAIAINGSPRKKWNTATLLEKALEGAASRGAETELVHLYDLSYSGCISCFACKKIGGKSYGKCAVEDGITPVLERAAKADVLILGSPMYLHAETGEMRSFMERLVFPYLTYTPGYASIYPGKTAVGLIYTMNVTEEQMAAIGQDVTVKSARGFLTRVYGGCEVQLCFDTLQFDDYGKYLSTAWDPAAKAKRRAEVFPEDCGKAFALGAALADKAAG